MFYFIIQQNKSGAEYKYCIDSEKVKLKTVLCLEYTKSLIFLLRWNKTVDMVVGKAYRSLGLVVMDGEESNACDVFSGVPQGSVLGIFLLYINDISTDVDSKFNLFADDCALYREIKSAEDASALQNDLDRLY